MKEVERMTLEDPPEPRWLHEDPEYMDPVTMAKAAAEVTPIIRAPRSWWCWFCRRATDGGRLLDTEDGVEAVCPDCWANEVRDAAGK